MSYAQYRLYLNGVTATADQLSRFEDITIEQEMDRPARGGFKFRFVSARTGSGDGETEAFLQGMSRIRLEIQIQSAAWVPLIDGPIINVEGASISEPGQSMLTLVVSDDSFYLHRGETVLRASRAPTTRSHHKFTIRFRRLRVLTSIPLRRPPTRPSTAPCCVARRWSFSSNWQGASTCTPMSRAGIRPDKASAASSLILILRRISGSLLWCSWAVA